MSEYSSLKATINANVKTNGNQEITGSVMNSVLNEMVNSLGAGYQFMGVATPTNPGTAQTPDYKCFYLATTPGTYTNLGGLVVADGEVALLKYDSAWTKEVTGIATAAQLNQLGKQVDGIKRTIDGTEANYANGGWNANGDNAWSSAWYRVLDYIPVSPGDIIVWNPGEVNGGIALVIYNSSKENINYFGANAVERTLTMPSGAAFIRPSFAKSTFDSAKIIRNGVVVWLPIDYNMGIKPQLNVVALSNGVVTDASDGYYNTLTIANNKVILDSHGVSIDYFGKRLKLKGPFEMAYDSTTAPNGAWVIDAQTLKDAPDGSSITVTSSIVKYASSGSSYMANNVILFTCYYGRLFGNGLFGNIILKEQINDDINNVSILAIDDLNSSFGNVVLDKDNKKVIIKKEGVRLKFWDKYISLSGSEDFEMAFDSTNHPNGGWFLKTSVIQGVANGGSVALSSDNIVYYSVDSEGYNKNILLFACYYNDFVASGIFGSRLLQRQIDAINIENPSVTINEAKCKQFSAYFNNSGICETFVFMTDPHLLGISNTFNEVQFAQYINTLAKYYDNTPVDWCICGGDWLNNSDYQDIACWKLGYMDATMRKTFKHYFPVLGNHDTNYQGVVSADDASRGDLTHQTLINLMFRENGNTYYKFQGNNTRFYVFDTGIDWETEMNLFKWGQIDWFANALIKDDAEHSVIIQHIFYTSGTSVNPMASNIQAIAGAYNSRQSITLNGITYNFSGCTGKIACVIAGHSHFDAIVTEGVSVPVWLTTNMMDGDVPTFDICIIDYTDGKMKSVRIGTGENREMTLA